VAYPSTITGSIGVVLTAPDLSGTLQKIGAKVEILKSGEFKDSGSVWREMSAADRALLMAMINDTYEQFLSVVDSGRERLTLDEIRALADGRVLLGEDAAKSGLIDQVGTIYDAIRLAKEAAGLANKNVVVTQYTRGASGSGNVYSSGSGIVPQAGTAVGGGGTLGNQINLVNIEMPEWLRDPSPKMWYLWTP
jgi:ClpP class serine protease